MILVFSQDACEWLHNRLNAARTFIASELKRDENKNESQQLLRVASKMKYKFFNNLLGKVHLTKAERALILTIASVRAQSLQTQVTTERELVNSIIKTIMETENANNSNSR